MQYMLWASRTLADRQTQLEFLRDVIIVCIACIVCVKCVHFVQAQSTAGSDPRFALLDPSDDEYDDDYSDYSDDAPLPPPDELPDDHIAGDAHLDPPPESPARKSLILTKCEFGIMCN